MAAIKLLFVLVLTSMVGNVVVRGLRNMDLIELEKYQGLDDDYSPIYLSIAYLPLAE